MARAPKAERSGGGGNVTYYEIANFQAGIDTRKSPMTAPAGTLRMLQNAHITPGGEIEKRSAFQYWCTAPSGSLGLVSLNQQFWTFYPGGGGGSYAPPTSSTVGYFNITPPPGVTLLRLMDWDLFNGQIFATFQGQSSGGTGSYTYYNGVRAPDGDGRCYACRTYKEKMYGIAGRTLYFSAVGDPTTWTDPTSIHNGSGYINVGTNDSDSEYLQTLEVYYDKMALFSLQSCQLWFLDPDPSLNQYYQTLRDAGTLAPLSVRQYVANDVYFLGAHGIRSLRARDLTTTAAVADVGSPIDPIIQDLIATSGSGSTEVQAIQTVLSTRTGRIWMVSQDRIYVLSNFASPNISAWSIYIPEFTVGLTKGAVVAYADPFVGLMDSSGNIWRYGSYGGPTYDSCPVSVLTPFLSFDKPASYKFYQGFDAICTAQSGNPWTFEMSFDPTQATLPWDTICQADGPTMLPGRIPVSGRGTHVAIRATHAAPGPATLSKMFVHYALSDTG